MFFFSQFAQEADEDDIMLGASVRTSSTAAASTEIGAGDVRDAAEEASAKKKAKNDENSSLEEWGEISNFGHGSKTDKKAKSHTINAKLVQDP